MARSASILLLTLLSVAFASPPESAAQHHTNRPVAPFPTVAARVQIDSARGEAYITAGPLRIPAATPYNHHFPQAPVTFTWPATGWLQGFRVDLFDASGRKLPREMLHHAGVTNLDRRQLAYPTAERVFAAGQESDPVSLPRSLGVPVSSEQKMLLYYAIANPTARDLEGVTLQVTLPWKSAGPDAPRSVMPMYFDAHPTPGGASTFDAPPGRSSTSAEFTLPASGNLRYVGGHLHEHGVELRLEDARTNKVLVRLKSDRDPSGAVRSMGRTRFPFRLNGLKLRANHRYRIVAAYDNPTAAPIRGAMGLMVAVFAPDDLSKWPVVDQTNESYRKDLAWLMEVGGEEVEAHRHTAVRP